MIEYKSLETHALPQGIVFVVENEKERNDFDDLLNGKVKIDGVLYLVKGIERYLTMPPYKKGVEIGLLVERVAIETTVEIPVKGNPFSTDIVGYLVLDKKYCEFLLDYVTEYLNEHGKIPEFIYSYGFFLPKSEIAEPELVDVSMYPDIPTQELFQKALDEFERREKLKENE